MKSGWIERGVLIVLGVLLAPLTMQADIVERKFFQKETGKSASGFVFQSSRNMRTRKSGKKRVLSEFVVVPFSVPSLTSSEQVMKTLQNQPQTRPRFGYGAEERKRERKAVVPTPAPAKPTVSPQPSPVYQFRYTYPVYREYLFGSPFFFSPGCSGRGHSHFPQGGRGFHYRSSGPFLFGR